MTGRTFGETTRRTREGGRRLRGAHSTGENTKISPFGYCATALDVAPQIRTLLSLAKVIVAPNGSTKDPMKSNDSDVVVASVREAQ